MRFPVHIVGNTKVVETKALIDSGATGIFIHWNLVRKHRIPTKPYAKPRIVRNVDNSINILGKITNYVEVKLRIGDHEEEVKMSVTDIGEDDLILGLPWLRRHNPAIDWRSGHMEMNDCPITCHVTMRKKRQQRKKAQKPVRPHRIAAIHGGVRQTIPQKKSIEPPGTRFAERIRNRLRIHKETMEQISIVRTQREFIRTLATNMEIEQELEGEDELYWTPGMTPEEAEEYTREEYIIQEEHIRRTSRSTELAEEAAKDKVQKSFEEIVPKAYWDYKAVFDDKASKRFPTSKPWDHHIELKPDAIPKTTCKVYPLTPAEQIALDEFLKEHLERGTIRKSNSPLASPFFFVKKKDGKLRPVQDYRRLNEMTVKNRYPLPLVTELLDRMSSAKIFTKMDVRFGYNNIRMADGDQWKAFCSISVHRHGTSFLVRSFRGRAFSEKFLINLR